MHRIRSAARTRRLVSSRAWWRSRSAPRSSAAATERMAAGLPSTAWVPAEMKRSGAPGWRRSSRTGSASAVGERHRLPVQTKRTLKVGYPASCAIDQRLLENALDLVGRDAARTQVPRSWSGEVDDGRGRPSARLAGVEEHVDVGEVPDDHLDGARGRLARPVGAGDRERPGALDERQGEVVLGHAQGDCAAGVAEVPADPGALAQHDGERPRPEL